MIEPWMALKVLSATLGAMIANPAKARMMMAAGQNTHRLIAGGTRLSVADAAVRPGESGVGELEVTASMVRELREIASRPKYSGR
ncbi:hypothetical protein GCM10027427_04710 [Pseudoclavibacter terrae]